MRTLPLLVSVALSACIIPAQPAAQQPGYGGGDPNATAPAGGDPNAGADPATSGYGGETGGAAPEAAPAGPVTVSVSMHNDCGQTVRLFLGSDPKFGSGTHTTLGSNTTTSQSFRAGDMVWLTDDNDNGIQSATVGAGTSRIQIDCGSISAQ